MRGIQQVFVTVTLLGSLLLSGCATMSESQCVANDWQTAGHRDGLAGKQSSQLMKHQDACVKHGVIPDREAYLAGWESGVKQYCQPQNGFTAGERGAGYSNVCPSQLQEPFYAAYQEGRQLYLAQSKIDELSRSISQKEFRLKKIATEISGLETELIENTGTSQERRELLDATKALAQEQGQLQTQIQEMKVEVALKTERLGNLRRTLAYAY